MTFSHLILFSFSIQKIACKSMAPALVIPSVHRFMDSRQLERYLVKITMEQQRINGSISTPSKVIRIAQLYSRTDV